MVSGGRGYVRDSLLTVFSMGRLGVVYSHKWGRAVEKRAEKIFSRGYLRRISGSFHFMRAEREVVSKVYLDYLALLRYNGKELILVTNNH